MARDGIFFRFAAAIHPKFRTPGNALIFQCCLASVMALTGTFEDLTSLFIFATWIFYGLAVVVDVPNAHERSPIYRARIAPGDIRWCRHSSSRGQSR